MVSDIAVYAAYMDLMEALCSLTAIYFVLDIAFPPPLNIFYTTERHWRKGDQYVQVDFKMNYCEKSKCRQHGHLTLAVKNLLRTVTCYEEIYLLQKVTCYEL